MAPPLLTLTDVGLTFGGEDLFRGAEMAVSKGDRVCLVGRNGCGKSTLLKVAAGLIESDQGERFVQPGIRSAYLSQEPDLSAFATVRDAVAAGLPEDERDQLYRVEPFIDDLRLDGDASTAVLSGGEARRTALAQTLIGEPDILMLDEPTNHLDLPAIQWLENYLQGHNGAFIIVSHDRAFLNALTKAIFWLDRGIVRRLDKGFDAFEAWSDEVFAKEDEEKAKLDKLIAEETVWSHQGITARRKRNEGRLRRLWKLRDEREQMIDRAGPVKLDVDSGNTSGKLVLEATDVTKAFGDKIIVSGFSSRILRGDRVGIIGASGVGKTTLLRMLIGKEEPDSGTVRRGTNLTLTYLDQARAALDPNKSLWDTLCDMGGDHVNVRGTPRHVVSYLRDFLFKPNQARTAVGALSGGERNRLLLAKTLAHPSNFLVLDEPTNDLDMDTLDLLQEMLSDYDGTLLIVSHDRDFLDRVVTATIAMEGNGTAIEYAGGYTDYTRQRSDATPAETPKRKAAPKEDSRPKLKTKTKLSYKQQRALDELPKTIATLEKTIATLETELADASLYSRNPDRFTQASQELEAAQSKKDACEEEWLELEMLREELENG